jgi:hypothetical protein
MRLFKKYPLGLILFLFPFSILQGQSCLCHPQDGQEAWYTVMAPSGLILREGPNRNTAKLDAIPFGEEVLSCGVTNFAETIEGKSGNWIKVTWADKTGYLFSGFLTAINDRKIRLVIPNSGVNSDWECLELSPEIKWEALVDMDTTNGSLRNRNPIRFSSTDLKIGKKKVDSGCSSTGFLNHGVLNFSPIPFAIFSGFNLTNGVKNQIITPIKLLPGEVADFSIYDRESQLERRYMIAAEGKVLPNTNLINGSYKGPIDRIEHYKINLYQQEFKSPSSDRNTPWIIQKLADGTVTKPGDTDTYDMDVLYVYFAGDLDGDHQLDLILARLNGVGNSFQLYLSSKKLPGFLLRYVAIWADPRC